MNDACLGHHIKVVSSWKPSLELLKEAIKDPETLEKIKKASDWFEVLQILRALELEKQKAKQ